MAGRALLIACLLCEIAGFAFTSYGVLRESFADIATTTGFGEGRLGEVPFGGGLTGFEELLVEIGVALRLLPADRVLTVTDRRRNAAFAVLGVILLGLAIVLDLACKVLSREV